MYIHCVFTAYKLCIHCVFTAYLLRIHYGLGVVQQRQAVAAGDRSLRQRERQQTARRQQERPHHQEGRRLHHRQGQGRFYFLLLAALWL